ncbi:MAG: ATP-binding protein, partial [Clostridiales bacterium]|nr:ATP-binding protein [Clostridiales bacterium]
MNNHIKVSEAFRILLFDLSDYVGRELSLEYGKDWWEKGVLNALYPDQRRNLPEYGEWNELVDSLDIANALLLFDLHWQQIFRKKLAVDHRTWAKELQGVRNRLAHLGSGDFSQDDTWRALDTMSRLEDAINPEGAEQIRAILRELRYGSAHGSTAVTQSVEEAPATAKSKEGILHTTPVSGLKPWREVMQPHPDVAQGRYKNAEFAADLAQVARGEGAYEYRDPVEFFARTYVTEGMAGLLEQALRRVTGGAGGEPVIQLKTAFGGGKTHSMLALYHMMRGQVSLEKIPAIKPVVESAGLHSL